MNAGATRCSPDEVVVHGDDLAYATLGCRQASVTLISSDFWPVFAQDDAFTFGDMIALLDVDAADKSGTITRVEDL